MSKKTVRHRRLPGHVKTGGRRRRVFIPEFLRIAWYENEAMRRRIAHLEKEILYLMREKIEQERGVVADVRFFETQASTIEVDKDK